MPLRLPLAWLKIAKALSVTDSAFLLSAIGQPDQAPFSHSK